MAKKNNIQTSLNIFNGIRLPISKVCSIAHKETDSRKEKRGDRGLKYKKKYDKDSE